jgi:hypothetical protein
LRKGNVAATATATDLAAIVAEAVTGALENRKDDQLHNLLQELVKKATSPDLKAMLAEIRKTGVQMRAIGERVELLKQDTNQLDTATAEIATLRAQITHLNSTTLTEARGKAMFIRLINETLQAGRSSTAIAQARPAVGMVAPPASPASSGRHMSPATAQPMPTTMTAPDHTKFAPRKKKATGAQQQEPAQGAPGTCQAARTTIAATTTAIAAPESRFVLGQKHHLEAEVSPARLKKQKNPRTAAQSNHVGQ